MVINPYCGPRSTRFVRRTILRRLRRQCLPLWRHVRFPSGFHLAFDHEIFTSGSLAPFSSGKETQMPTPLEKAREYLDPLEVERGGPRAERTKTASRLMRCTAPVSDAADLRRPENTSVTRRTRPIAIICQPWDHVASESNNSIVTVSYQLARCLARERHVTIYGRRKSGQESREIDSENIEFRHLKIRHRPQAIICSSRYLI
jgi:hypothetical protein